MACNIGLWRSIKRRLRNNDHTVHHRFPVANGMESDVYPIVPAWEILAKGGLRNNSRSYHRCSLSYDGDQRRPIVCLTGVEGSNQTEILQWGDCLFYRCSPSGGGHSRRCYAHNSGVEELDQMDISQKRPFLGYRSPNGRRGLNPCMA